MTQSAQTNRSSKKNQFILLLFGLFWTGFSSMFLILGLTDDDWVTAVIGGIFLIIGFFILGYGLLTMLSRYMVGNPDILLSNQHNLAVGETLTVRYTHSFRTRVLIEKLSVSLIFRERATYQQGTKTKTVTHDEVIDYYEEPGRHYESGELIQGSHQFQLPVDAMHSLKVRRNELIWMLQFKLEVANLPDYVNEYELTVLPRVVNNV